VLLRPELAAIAGAIPPPTPFDANDPVNTPRDLNVAKSESPPGARRRGGPALGAGPALDAPLGDVQ